MKQTENVEEPDDFGRKSDNELRPDYEINLSKSLCEDWLKDNNLLGTSSDQEVQKIESNDTMSSMQMKIVYVK